MKTLRIAILFLLSCCAAFGYGSGPEKTTVTHPKTPRLSQADEPFSTFQELDRELSTIDGDKQKLQAQLLRAAKMRSQARRTRAMNALRRSQALRDLLRSSRKLVASTTKGEALYGKRKQRYGALLFRDLRVKANAMRNPLLQEQKQSTLAGFKYEQRLFSRKLLVLITQFQAVSGGYGALACDPGGWACCQPRAVKVDGKTEIRGCTWACASVARKCRGGCLGPQTPQTAVAVRTVKPRQSPGPQSPGLSAVKSK
jgi:hypothetical protein